MVSLDPLASKSAHEIAIAEYLRELDPEFGAILGPYIRFDSLEQMSDTDRRNMRSEIAAAIRAHLDSDGTGP